MQGVDTSQPHPRGGIHLHPHLTSLSLLSRLSVLLFLGSLWLLAGCTSQGIPNQVVFDRTGGWQASLSLAGRVASLDTDQSRVGGLTDLATVLKVEGMDLNWQIQGQTPDGPLYAAEIQGSGGPEQLRALLFGELSESLNPLGESTALSLEGSVQRGETLQFVLESNPSTGYLWEAVQLTGASLSPVGEIRFEPRSDEKGAPERQVMSYQALQDGWAQVVWVYRRPWEEASGQARSLSIRAPELAQIADLSNPQPALPVFELPEQQLVSAALVSEDTPLKLPSSFDWRSRGILSPVRDQGSCGSCWAFAAVSVLESAVRIQDGLSVDLSEQYLVSCNQESWGCGGGWTAHDYHLNRKLPTESLAGAVLETNFPYAGRNLACQGPYSHPYRIQNWSDIGSWNNPDIDGIKRAIYTYGSVQSAVCVGPKFLAYRGGVFTADESRECMPVNHAVNLVGWDDSLGEHGVWIVRNSWGTNWGDKGYMLIDRGVSRIGYAASYVDYKGAIRAPQLDNLVYMPAVSR